MNKGGGGLNLGTFSWGWGAKQIFEQLTQYAQVHCHTIKTSHESLA
jgi:hypothetical protein